MEFKNLKEKEILLLSHLREDGRMTLTDLSKKTGIPVSTSYEKLKRYKNRIKLKPTILLDFKEIGYKMRTFFLVRVSEDKEEDLKDFLKKSGHLNSLLRINNQFDFLFDCFFKSLVESEKFERDLKKFCSNIKHHYTLEEIEKQNFLSNGNLIESGVF